MRKTTTLGFETQEYAALKRWWHAESVTESTIHLASDKSWGANPYVKVGTIVERNVWSLVCGQRFQTCPEALKCHRCQTTDLIWLTLKTLLTSKVPVEYCIPPLMAPHLSTYLTKRSKNINFRTCFCQFRHECHACYWCRLGHSAWQGYRNGVGVHNRDDNLIKYSTFCWWEQKQRNARNSYGIDIF